ncbi:gibberellin regulated-like protein [Synechococcus sp. MU1643]|uniref:gibberellin regulated-like protein n=1 Tax=Synechococcus sp. MU1643 TaxID=2508349 RepID=UPI001CF8D815|nr:gibberellin regulated-like protein [Synechococcus sp. MU1643]
MVNQTPGMAHGKGMYTTEIEAQQRADEIGCSSVHENNGRWMPCTDERELHQQLRKQ